MTSNEGGGVTEDQQQTKRVGYHWLTTIKWSHLPMTTTKWGYSLLTSHVRENLLLTTCKRGHCTTNHEQKGSPNYLLPVKESTSSLISKAGGQLPPFEHQCKMSYTDQQGGNTVTTLQSAFPWHISDQCTPKAVLYITYSWTLHSVRFCALFKAYCFTL